MLSNRPVSNRVPSIALSRCVTNDRIRTSYINNHGGHGEDYDGRGCHRRLGFGAAPARRRLLSRNLSHTAKVDGAGSLVVHGDLLLAHGAKLRVDAQVARRRTVSLLFRRPRPATAFAAEWRRRNCDPR